MSIFRRRFSLHHSVDPKAKWKDIQENYDHHHNKNVSAHVHRGDLSTTTRLLGYTDAMMATCATFLVIPIKYSKSGHGEGKNNESVINNDTSHEEANGDESAVIIFLDSIKIETLMFFIGFLLVTTIWESTNIRSIAIKRLDDFLVLLSILQLLFTTVLPFTVALQGHFPGNTITVLATTIVLLLVEMLEAVIIVYAFASPRLLHIEMKNWPVSEIRPIRNALLKKNLINVALISTGALFEFYDYRISWLFFSFLILNPIVRKLYLYIKRRQEPPETEHTHFYWFLMKGNISKERVEGFTDAATAIIACVMILDIVIEQFKSIELITPDHLLDELKHLSSEFISFLGAYVGVSLLWYVNHTVVHLFHTINTVILYLQKLFLCFLALVPLCANVVVNFTGKTGDTQLTIQFVAVITFLASLCNLLMVLWGYHKKEKVFHQWAVKSRKRHSRRQQLYTKMKVANMPYWSLVCFIGGFGSIQVARVVAIVSYVGMCVTFIVLKLLFVNHLGKEERTKELGLTVKYKGDRRGLSRRMEEMPTISEGANSAGTNRVPSDSVIARLGESEMTENEERIEKKRNVEFNGNEETSLSSSSDSEDNEDDESIRAASHTNKALDSHEISEKTALNSSDISSDIVLDTDGDDKQDATIDKVLDGEDELLEPHDEILDEDDNNNKADDKECVGIVQHSPQQKKHVSIQEETNETFQNEADDGCDK